MRLRILPLTLFVPVLLTGCMSLHQPLGLPDSSVLSFDGKQIVPPDCNALNQPSTILDAGFTRPSVAFGCATYTNLGAMLVRPADLVAPERLGAPSATTGAAAVRRYNEGTVTPLSKDALQ